MMKKADTQMFANDSYKPIVGFSVYSVFQLDHVRGSNIRES